MRKILLITMLLLSFASIAFAKISDEHFAIGGIYVGQSISQVKAIYGEPVKTDVFQDYKYCKYAKNDTKFNIRFKSNIVDYVYVEGNNGIATVDGIKVGSAKEDIIKTYGQPDFHERGGSNKTHPDSEFIRYYPTSGRNIFLNFEVRYGKVLNFDISTFVDRY